jgi:nitroreductase
LTRKTLQLPDDWSVYSAVAVGHPAEHARAAKLGGRKPLDELVNWETYGNR